MLLINVPPQPPFPPKLCAKLVMEKNSCWQFKAGVIFSFTANVLSRRICQLEILIVLDLKDNKIIQIIPTGKMNLSFSWLIKFRVSNINDNATFIELVCLRQRNQTTMTQRGGNLGEDRLIN